MKKQVFLYGLFVAAMLCTVPACRDSASSADALPPLPLEATPASGVGATFTEVTEASGVRFVQSFGDNKFSNLVEAVGSGVAFLDYDRDGWIDLYLSTGKQVEGVSQGEQPAFEAKNRLFRNRGNGTFEDVTDLAGVAAEGSFTMGLAAGDFDNDGYPDLYLCNYGRSILFRNNGDGTFSDVAATAGVTNEGLCSVAATWLDYDKDGLPDLYVSSYIDFDPDYNLYYAPDGFPGPLAYKAEPDRLYRNLGNSRFRDVSAETGIAGLEGRGMSVTSLDYNEDGYPDLYVTNDGTENFLLRNNGGRGFSQVALESGVGYNGMGDSTASMGIDFGDYDSDGRSDLFVSDNSLSSLYRNEGGGVFTDVVVESGVALRSAQFVGWGSFFFDFDNDGDLDILKVNSDLSRLFGQEDQVLENIGGGRFRDVSLQLGDYFKKTLLGRGAAFGDYDNDGDLDVVISNIDGPAVVLRNDGGHRRHWITLTLSGRASCRDGLGALVQVSAGGLTQRAYRKATNGYLSGSDPRLHFGLGDARRIERLEIIWPSGVRQVLENVEANQILNVEEPAQ